MGALAEECMEMNGSSMFGIEYSLGCRPGAAEKRCRGSGNRVEKKITFVPSDWLTR